MRADVRASRFQAILVTVLALVGVSSLRSGAEPDPLDLPPASLHPGPAEGGAGGFHGLPEEPPEAPPPVLSHRDCEDNRAGHYPCANVHLESRLLPADLGGSGANDIWGWTDPVSGAEYALIGLNNGTAFVDVSDPHHPVRLGNLRTHTTSSTWRDIKVYGDHAFIVSEARRHGMQVFDLTALRSVPFPPQVFTETAHYARFGNAHNVFVNEETAFAYVVGSNTCAGGLHMIDVQDPTHPTFAGCFAADGYTHDVQCVVYAGPDAEHRGSEICFASNEDTLTIVDVTDKSRPRQIVRKLYSKRGYTHQAWLTEDHRHLLMDDELDELRFNLKTRTLVWDVTDLEGPFISSVHSAATRTPDHNQYVVGKHVYQSNYRAGLRILDMGCAEEPTLQEVAHFDVYPPNDNRAFSGSWSNYPFFESGNVIVSSIEQGLFVLRPELPCTDDTPPEVVAGAEDLHCLWPPTRQRTCFGIEDFAPELSDDCGEVSWEFESCEALPSGSETHAWKRHDEADCVVSPDRICVRAALSRTGWRRVDRRYEVRVAATDACGNRSEETSIGNVRVLRRLRDAPQCSDLTLMPPFDRIHDALSKRR